MQQMDLIMIRKNTAVILIVGEEFLKAVRKLISFLGVQHCLDLPHSFRRKDPGHGFIPACRGRCKSWRHSAKLHFLILQVESCVLSRFRIKHKVPVCHICIDTAY